MQAQKEAPADMQCKDKFLLQCVVASPGATAKEVTPEMFSKEAGHRVEETKLRVVYVDPPQPPSPVREGSEEGSSPRASVSDSANVSDFTTAPRFRVDRLEPQENSSEVFFINLLFLFVLCFHEAGLPLHQNECMSIIL
ncbi:hypothetical protein YC2023_091219 [Brassica napus]